MAVLSAPAGIDKATGCASVHAVLGITCAACSMCYWNLQTSAVALLGQQDHEQLQAQASTAVTRLLQCVHNAVRNMQRVCLRACHSGYDLLSDPLFACSSPRWCTLCSSPAGANNATSKQAALCLSCCSWCIEFTPASSLRCTALHYVLHLHWPC
jgi:hypothetical protein